MTNSDTTVLIVGAGAVGMAAAISLHSAGFQADEIMVVDALEAGQNTSRAMALDSVGCSDKLVAQGMKVTRLDLMSGPAPFISVNFAALAPYTKFPFGLAIPQTMTEAVMLEKLAELGIEVRRPLKAVRVRAAPGGKSEVEFESGEVITARYLIGADGAHSVVREQAGIAFTDPDGDAPSNYGNLSQMALADVAFDSPPPELIGKPFIHVANGGFTLASQFPPASSRDPARIIHRIATSVPVEDGTLPHAPSKGYLQSLLDRSGPALLSSDPSKNPNPVRIAEVFWSSRYRTRFALADRFFTRLSGGTAPTPGGPILLIGDAAHIHSPVGGQGLSLGIRDAISLGPVLRAFAFSENATENDALLEEWATARSEKARIILTLTKGITGMAAGVKVPRLIKFVGYYVVRFLARFAFMQGTIAWRISGLAQSLSSRVPTMFSKIACVFVFAAVATAQIFSGSATEFKPVPGQNFTCGVTSCEFGHFILLPPSIFNKELHCHGPALVETTFRQGRTIDLRVAGVCETCIGNDVMISTEGIMQLDAPHNQTIVVEYVIEPL
ncbi:FAD-binding-3 domain-containing protein [Mycena kentingensis (nom. inval.)]|nr:FAD-binding-3 domain-containing protein [Mycena kentingensis (nom. inval.)]